MAFGSDLRYAARGLRASRGFTLAAIATMAVGIGATAAIFAIVNAVLLRPLPIAGTDRVVAIGSARAETPSKMQSVSIEDLRDWQGQSRTIAAFAAWRDWGMARYDDPNEKGVYAAIVTPDIFRVFPVKPVLGRLFRAEDDTPGQNRLVLLAYGYWRSRFGSDPSAVGRTMVLEREDKAVYTIIGVLPAEFNEMPSFDGIKLFTLSSTDPDAAIGRSHRNRLVFARLDEHASLRQARAEMNVIADRLARQYPATNARIGILMQPLIDHEVGPMAATLRSLFAAVGLVLVIACANVASLQLARALTRRREFAVRAALGGTRWVIARGALMESAILAAIAGVAGLVGAHWLVQIVLRTGPVIPRAEVVHFSAAVVAFAFLCCAAASLLVALPTSWLMAASDPAGGLKDDPGRSGGKPAVRARKTFVVAQVGLAMMLLTTAVVAGETLRRQLTMNPGFNAEGLAAVQVFTSLDKYPTAQQASVVFARTIDESQRIQGLTSISAVSAVPTSGEGSEPVELVVGDGAEAPQRLANSFNVAPGYFRTLGVPLLRGRDFNEIDRTGAPGVAIVNATFVRRYLPAGSEPLGVRLKLAHGGDVVTIVGVAGDMLQEVKARAVPEPEIYWPYSQRPRRVAFMVVRASDPTAAIAAVRARALSIDPSLSINAPRIPATAIAKSARGPRFLLLLFGLFATVAVLLSAIGVYGLVSYTAAQRTREIGVRVTLGASPRHILRLVALDGFSAVAVGSVVGVAGTLATTRVLASALPQMEPLRPLEVALAAVLLSLLGCLACYLPARRARSVDPVEALRTA